MFPEPVQGLVIRYSYLWRAEFERGREEGIKDRPCAVILVTTGGPDAPVVTVLPITHSIPRLADTQLKSRSRLSDAWVWTASAHG